LNGLKSKSRTVPVCPLIIGNDGASLPDLFNGMTANGPPPPAAQLTPKKVQFPFNPIPSGVPEAARTPMKFPSFTGSPKT